VKKLSILSVLILVSFNSIFASQPLSSEVKALSEVKDKKEKLQSQKAKPAIPEYVKKALKENKWEPVEEFMCEGSLNAQAVDKDGNTLLHLAATYNADKIIHELLMWFPFDETIFNNDGLASIHIAAQKKNTFIIGKFAYFGGYIFLQDKNGNTIMDHLPIAAIERDRFQAYMDKFIEINKVNRTNNSQAPQITDECFNNLCPADSDKVIEQTINLRIFLNENSHNINAVDKDGNGLLHKILQSGQCDHIDLLLVRGANPNALNNAGESPLLVCLKTGPSFVYKNLIDFGADVNVQDKDGNSPLHYAVKLDCQDAVKYLLAHNANPQLDDKWKKKPIDYAKNDAMRALLKTPQPKQTEQDKKKQKEK
jgi:ankyrin repeat protein